MRKLRGAGRPPPSGGPHGLRRRRRTQLAPLQVAGLLAIVSLCASYIYFVSHSPRLSQGAGFRRSVQRPEVAQHELRSLRFGGGDEHGAFRATRGEADARLLLASHNRLLWYHYITGRVDVLHEGKGVYYGMFPGTRVDAEGRPTSVWVVSRPHNWHPETALEQLLEIDFDTGEELQAATLDSRFTHDVARRGSKVYVCSTEAGAILELATSSLKQTRKLELFTLKEHVNSVAPLQRGALWALLHNLGQSELVRVDLQRGAVTKRLTGIGTKAHGIVAWRGSLLVLDSAAGGLLRVNPFNGSHTTLYQIPEGGKFLKGLAVIDDIAYFGVSLWSTRAARGDLSLDGELAAFCLRGMALLWRREVPTHGLLNVVAAPHLAVASTYRALEPQLVRPRKDPASIASRQTRGNSTAGHRTAARTLTEFPAVVGGKWATGQPRLDLAVKLRHPLRVGIQLPLLRVDVKPIQQVLAAAGDRVWQEAEQQRSNAYFAGRTDNMDKFKHGVETIVLVFSDKQGVQAYEFPWYARFKAALEPLLRQVLGERDMANIIRLQIARMRPGISIKLHTDHGGWALGGHRIHVPIAAAPGVSFLICPETETTPQTRHTRHSKFQAGADSKDSDDCWPVNLEEGYAFEINNNLPHRVDNDSAAARIHLIIDVSEQPHKRTLLQPGQKCHYSAAAVTC